MPAPTTFTKSRAAAICRRIANGESLRRICETKGMPTRPTVFKWIRENDDFRAEYALAREMQADLLADELLEVARTPQVGIKRELDDAGKVIKTTEGDMIEHRRVLIDALKWKAGKLRPKVYGDKVHQELTGENGGPIQTEAAVTVYIPSNSRDG